MSDTLWMRVAMQGAHVMIVGGGDVAARKARKFLDAGARVEVVSPALSEAMSMCSDEITWRQEEFSGEVPAGVRYVVAATHSAEVNARVAAVCGASGVPVNVVDRSAPSTLHLPTSFEVQDIEVSLFLSGASPALTVVLRERLRDFLVRDEPWWGEAAAVLGEVREAWMEAHAGERGRAVSWRALTHHVLARLRRGERAEDVRLTLDDVSSDEEMG